MLAARATRTPAHERRQAVASRRVAQYVSVVVRVRSCYCSRADRGVYAHAAVGRLSGEVGTAAVPAVRRGIDRIASHLTASMFINTRQNSFVPSCF